ncbi:MarR family winged helix-turn-helix transcriptional regulator [Yinghuangia sp. YIM S10712]|uniref:MarR family winged helix-turn-helix transcriptional regulator n=1 Tax=Yinghuangia sp. YIM S10712 TaxID=3436930 RepID=UPI003F53BA09
MDGYELFRLGRTLMKLGEQAMPEMGTRRLSGATRAIVADVFENPDSSVSDITERVGYPQSQVSACVANLREHGSVETVTDPRDRRRTLVRPSAAALERARNLPPAEIDDTVARATGSTDPADIARVKDALNALDALLEPYR